MKPITLTPCLMMLALATARLNAATPQDIENALRKDIAASLDDFSRSLNVAAPEPDVRDLTHAALYLLATDQDSAKAEALLRDVMRVQDMDAKSAAYGDVPWKLGHPEIKDRNAVEFTMLPIGPILLAYQDKLSADCGNELRLHAQAAIAAIRRHQVPTRYTNIYMMKMTNLLLLGEATEDPQAIREAEEMLSAWIEETSRTGIGEFTSATYSAVQINCVSFAHTYTHQTNIRKKLAHVLDLLYADALANYFPASQKMVGCQSRSYGFVAGRGPIEKLYFQLGLRDSVPKTILPDGGRFWVAAHDGAPMPSAKLLAMASLPERVYKTKWGLEPGKDRYLYMTPDFAIGSSGCWYSPQDRQIAVDVAREPDFPPVQVVADGFDNPYGRVGVTSWSGHIKPAHLNNLSSTVQEKGTILALWDLGTNSGNSNAKSIATNIVFPLLVDQIVLNDQPVQLARQNPVQMVKPAETTSAADTVLGLRYGRAAVAVRFFRIDGVAGTMPVIELKNDYTEKGVGRLAVYHYRNGERPLNEKTLRVGMFVTAESCPTPEAWKSFIDRMTHAEIQQEIRDSLWSAKVTMNGLTLESTLDSQAKFTAGRKVNGQPYLPEMMSLNGVNLMSQLLTDPLSVP